MVDMLKNCIYVFTFSKAALLNRKSGKLYDISKSGAYQKTAELTQYSLFGPLISRLLAKQMITHRERERIWGLRKREKKREA